MLYKLARSGELAPFLGAVWPLAAYDRERGGDLLRTLRAFFECGENVSRAAEALFLHRNSVPYRLERVRELTGLDYRDHDQRLALELGLLALEEYTPEQERREDEDERA